MIPMVLHVRVVTGRGGGPDKTILRSARHVRASGIRMGAAYIYPRGDRGIADLRTQAIKWGSPWWQIPESGALDLRTVHALLKLCRNQQVSVWHAHDYKSNLLGLLLSKRHRMKLVTTAHGWTRDTVRTRLYYQVDNLCLPRYDHVVVVSPLIYDHCVNLGIAHRRLTYLPNAIDPAEYVRTRHRAAACAQMQLGQERFHIGVVSRLSAEKGVDRAIEMLAHLAPRYPRTSLHLIGDGPQRPMLRRLVMRRGLTNRVTFWRWQTNLQPFYEMMDMLLLPSHTEGLPNVVLEAMAMGVPVAATDVGGVRHLLDNGRCGVILPQDDAQWHSHIAPLVVSDSRRAALARLAHDRVTTHFTFEKRMKKMIEVYDQVVGIPSLQRRDDRPITTERRAA